MLDFVIIGGGIHGTYLSNVLINALGWSPHKIKVLDPQDTPCQRWGQLTSKTGMEFLRSPVVHHLGLSPWDLRSFLQKNESTERANSFGRYERPSLALFNKHVESVCAAGGLLLPRVTGSALSIRRIRHGLRVESTGGNLDSRRVIVATNSNDRPLIPQWASQAPGQVSHIFDSSFSLGSIVPGESIAVVGAGITAAQFALRACSRSPAKVHLLIRHPLKIAEFDSDACWMGPKCLSIFALEKDYTKRRQMIKQARNKGTLTPEVYAAIECAVAQGKLKVTICEVESCRKVSPFKVELLNKHGDQLCEASRVILSTGFVPGRPGGALIDSIIANFNSPVASDGFPIVDEGLHWSDGIYVSGALAELEVGPPARNILGARLSGERMMLSLKAS